MLLNPLLAFVYFFPGTQIFVLIGSEKPSPPFLVAAGCGLCATQGAATHSREILNSSAALPLLALMPIMLMPKAQQN